MTKNKKTKISVRQIEKLLRQAGKRFRERCKDLSWQAIEARLAAEQNQEESTK